MKREGWKTWEELVSAPIPKTIINERVVELRLVVNNERLKDEREPTQ